MQAMSVRTSIGQADFGRRVEVTERREATAPMPTTAQASQGVAYKREDNSTPAITSLARLLARQAAAEFVAAQDKDLPQ